jgi:hypothetical protein
MSELSLHSMQVCTSLYADRSTCLESFKFSHAILHDVNDLQRSHEYPRFFWRSQQTYPGTNRSTGSSVLVATNKNSNFGCSCHPDNLFNPFCKFEIILNNAIVIVVVSGTHKDHCNCSCRIEVSHSSTIARNVAFRMCDRFGRCIEHFRISCK